MFCYRTVHVYVVILFFIVFFFLWKKICLGFVLYFIIHIVIRNPIIKRGELDPMNPFNPTTCVCLSQVTTCIFIGICRAIFFILVNQKPEFPMATMHDICPIKMKWGILVDDLLKIVIHVKLSSILWGVSEKKILYIDQGPSWLLSYGSCEFESRSGWGVQHYVMFVSYLWQIGGFLRVLLFQPRYNWNIVESGFKHH